MSVLSHATIILLPPCFSPPNSKSCMKPCFQEKSNWSTFYAPGYMQKYPPPFIEVIDYSCVKMTQRVVTVVTHAGRICRWTMFFGGSGGCLSMQVSGLVPTSWSANPREDGVLITEVGWMNHILKWSRQASRRWLNKATHCTGHVYSQRRLDMVDLLVRLLTRVPFKGS